MSSLSALATRVVLEVNDSTNNTLSASVTGTLYSEVQQYVVDGIRDYSNYVYREVFDNSIVTSANRRSYVVSQMGLDSMNIPDAELWSGSMYLFSGDQPIFPEANNYFNIWYHAEHDTPSAGSAALTLETKDEEIVINYAKAKIMEKAALDQRGINQDTSNEFLNIAQVFERRYKEATKKAQTPFISYKG